MVRCAFCGKTQEQVKRLIAGPGVYICDECVMLCNEIISEELGIGDNETTEDGLFSLSMVSCLGCCSLAPVMMINEDTYGSLTPDKVKQILRDIRTKEAQ